ncbi:yecA family protein [Natronocella acetinitrilica]|uniref:YecA family protein n=1 Tax=Natronocella acetinitrilica TaxID=414046 RepID=A0AAE3G0D5_9GAMM|nr:UPF0149 family protein [Natronocella acetinitrilica]MCP1672992.1 yecA family protein [Natronocella acetinitrilica]
MQNTPIDYDDVQAALSAVGSPMDAAEAHGILCGLFAAAGQADAAGWMAQVLDGTEPRGEEARRVLERLASTYDETRRGLDDSNLSFDLLLPGDATPLHERAAALGGWCSGFLFGLGSGSEAKALPSGGDVEEAVAGLAEIARVDAEAADGSDEAAYSELVEFVRVSALMIRENLQPVTRAKPVDVPGAPGGQRLH